MHEQKTLRSNIDCRILTIIVAAPLTFAANPKITLKGTGVIRAGSSPFETGYEVRQGPASDAHFIRKATGSTSAARVPSEAVPRPTAAVITGPGANFAG